MTARQHPGPAADPSQRRSNGPRASANQSPPHHLRADDDVDLGIAVDRDDNGRRLRRTIFCLSGTRFAPPEYLNKQKAIEGTWFCWVREDQKKFQP